MLLDLFHHTLEVPNCGEMVLQLIVHRICQQIPSLEIFLCGEMRDFGHACSRGFCHVGILPTFHLVGCAVKELRAEGTSFC